MRQAEGTFTAELPELGPVPASYGAYFDQAMVQHCGCGWRRCTNVRHHECPRCGRLGVVCEWPSKPATAADQPKRRGAYRGAVKLDSERHRMRALTGRTQAEFAQLVGCSVRTVRNWESGAHDTKPELARAIMRALAVRGIYPRKAQ